MKPAESSQGEPQEIFTGRDHLLKSWMDNMIDALDIIQLSAYQSSTGEEYWHTKEDTLDKVRRRVLGSSEIPCSSVCRK